jgi:hypothetical protein
VGPGILGELVEWGLGTGCAVGFEVEAAWAGWHRLRLVAFSGGLLLLSLRKPEGTSNLLNLCIDKLSSSAGGGLP